MSKYIQMGLVFFYVLVTIFAFLLVLVLSGLHLSNVAGWWIVAGWVALCYASAYIRAGMAVLAKYRRPTRREEERLAPAIQEILQKVDTKRRVCVWIEESRDWNAHATGVYTIAITRGLLEALSPDELRGVLAHELGHLLSGDTLVAAAFVTAGLLPQGVFRVYRIGTGLVRSTFLRVGRVSLLGGVAVLLLLGYGLYRIHLLKAVVPVILFVLFFSILNRIFYFLRLLLMRLAEYRQDTFAFRMGYGEGLVKALGRLAAAQEPPVNRYFIMLHSTHPVIYNRIRRLEKLLYF